MCMHIQTRGNLILRQYISVDMELVNEARLGGQCVPGIILSLPPQWGYRYGLLYLAFCMGAGDPSSSPHGCTVTMPSVIYQRESRRLEELIEQSRDYTFESEASCLQIQVLSLKPCASDVYKPLSSTKLHFPTAPDSCGFVIYTRLTQQPPPLPLTHQSPSLDGRWSFLTRN